MTSNLPFGNNPLTLHVYEPFSFTISNPSPETSTLTISNTPGIPPGFFVNNVATVVFSTSNNTMSIGTEVFVVSERDISGNVVATSSNTVSTLAGRFVDPSGNGYNGSNYTFHRNEPITPIQLVAPFTISAPTSVPSLPPGLGFTSNDSNIYSVAGTPIVTVPQSNYLFIGRATGSNLGKIVTSQIGFSISNERVRLNLAGSPIVSSMTVGTPIAERVVTAAFPPYPSGGTLRYNWSGLPDGIYVEDGFGATQTTGFTLTAAPYSLVITGAPTLAAATAFRDAGITSNVVTFTATRTSPSPVISNSIALSFAFGETVLFDAINIPPLYTGVALDPLANVYRAQTYFGTGSAISSISSPDLRSDLSLNFIGTGRARLFGTPTTAGSGTFTISALNDSGITGELLSTIVSVNDIVTIVPPVDVCYNFVVSRPSALPLAGYYPSNIRFQASADSGNAVTFSATGLNGTGLSLSNISANTVQIVGIPNTVTPLSTVTVTATAATTLASASRSIQVAVLDDVITFADVSGISFIQNRAITPIQFSATTLSERTVISYTSPNLPTGLSLSSTGVLTGTPTVAISGTFTINASTGFSNGARVFAYTLTPDTAIFLTNPVSYTYSPGDQVSIDLDGVTYSGNALSNYALVGFVPSYGVSINSNTGIISGTLESGTPPDPLFPLSPVAFSVTAQSGVGTSTLPATLSVVNPPLKRAFLLAHWSGFGASNVEEGLTANDDTTLVNWPTQVSVPGVTTLAVKNNTTDFNTYLMFDRDGVYRSTDGVSFSYSTNGDNGAADWPGETIPDPGELRIYSAIYDSSASVWNAVGTRPNRSYQNEVEVCIFRSSNDGINWEQETLGGADEGPPSTPGSGFGGETSGLPLAPRQTPISNYYSDRGVAFAVKDNVWLVGGGYSAVFVDSPTGRRSEDGGINWTEMFNAGGEVAKFSVEDETWVAAGSDRYTIGSGGSASSGNAITLQWSDDLGVTWGVASGAPQVIATDVAYASNTWLAAGMTFTGVFADPLPLRSQLVCSSDGKTWSNVDLSGVTFTESPLVRLPEVGPIWSDGSNWNVIVNRYLATPTTCEIYSHSLTGNLTTGWARTVSNVQPFAGQSNIVLSGFQQQVVRLASPTQATFSFNVAPGTGPTLTSPADRSFIFYQYVSIAPVVFSATGTGTIYFFIVAAELPRGIQFDPITATLSGTSVELGSRTFSIYIKDDLGVTQVLVSTNTILPRVVRQQTSAGSWTSLVRQYTIVNSAQNSVDGRVLPASEATLGSFTRPEPPDSTSAVSDPNCVRC